MLGSPTHSCDERVDERAWRIGDLRAEYVLASLAFLFVLCARQRIVDAIKVG